MDATVKKKIGKYEITGILGRGGMGVVYRAEDKRIGRQVAIKTLTEGFTGQPEMLERFYREAQAGILQHPNIVIVYDLGDEDGVPFIVMEFVSGEPLDKVISSGRQLSMVERLSIIEQVCAGLGYAHQRGVVHRDIKPANVILQPDGQAKIVDFGIARVAGSSSEGGLTRTGNVIGTIHYIAPERLRGQRFDGRSDIFATGVMLYLLLTGQLPFTGEDMTVLQKLVNEPHPPLKNWLTAYPPALDGIIDRALAKDPEERYATAEEFAGDLHALGEELKRGQVAELYSDAERLAAEQQFGRAREVLLQLVRIDPGHTGARPLLGVVQQNLARLQRAEQIRQLVAEAEEAMASSRFPEAMGSLDQAVKLDPENPELLARLEDAKEKKRRYDEIATLMTQADSLRDRGDITGALNVVERALRLDQDDAKIRAAHADLSRQAKIAAQQGQIRDLLGKAKQELGSRRFTAAIEILREVGKIDPSQAEAESLMQAALTSQEQERRRKILEQIQAEIENSLASDDFERATEQVDRAVERLPNEPALLQLKTRVALQARKLRAKQLIDSTVVKAQETFLNSPGEALLIVQRALQELPGEERLLALEDTLRQRLKSAEKEEVRGRYLREAQGAIDRSQFDKAVEILESYQLEFTDAAGVEELLEFAKSELAQQQRRERIAASATQARALMQEERFEQAIGMLEAACKETSDPALARLLSEARTQQQEADRKAEALLTRIGRLRERGQIEEAIGLLQATPGAAATGTRLNTLLVELRGEQGKKQAKDKALAAATKAFEQGNFQGAIEALQSVQRAYGESADVASAIAEIEARRAQFANEAVAKSVEAARAALLTNDAAGALKELKGTAELFEFADATRQADWRRLNAEAAKPAARRTGQVPQVGTVSMEIPDDGAGKKKPPILILAGGALVVVVAALALVFHPWSPKPAPPAPTVGTQVPVPATAQPTAAPTGTLIVQGNVAGAGVLVDGKLKDFTVSGGPLRLSLDPGTHSIQFSKPGYIDSKPTTVTVSAGGQAPLQFQLVPSGAPIQVETVGYLSIHSTPLAQVKIDGAAQGNTDAHGELMLQVKPGPHSLEISAAGYQPASQNFANIKAGDRVSVPAPLTPKPVEVAKVQPVQISFFSASVPQIDQGQSTTLKWQTANAVEVVIDDGSGSPKAQSSTEVTVSPSGDTNYVLTARGSDGSTQSRVLKVSVKAKAVAAQPQPPPPPSSGNTAPATVDERPAVMAVFGSFNAALGSHNVAGLQAAFPGMPQKAVKGYQNLFKDFPKVKISDECPASALSISGGTATLSCTETTVIPGEKPQGGSIHFTFTKKSGTWAIADRQ